MQKKIPNYVTEIKPGLSHIISGEWNDLLNQQTEPTPFMRHEYLLALELSHSACQETGWLACVITLRDEAGLAAACLVYIKNHSYGEYVFDWAWADAYTRHGLAYYPKAIVSSAFTPVPGSRLLARNQFFRHALLQEVLAWCKTQQLSSLHLLFGSDIDIQTAKDCGLLERTTVQFHWQNPQTSTFEQYLNLMQQDKRKKIRQERKKVQQAGIQFRWSTGQNISQHD